MARDRAARPEARTLRLFVAVNVPAAVRNRLAEEVAPLRDVVPGARWAPAENWHVTVKFLGSVSPRLRSFVEEAVAAVAAATPAFESRLTSLGAFPSPRRARVLWAGLEDPGGVFRALAAGLDRSLEREFRAEQRPFTPHLTVARMNVQATLRPEVLATDVASEPFPVRELLLYRSHLGRPHAHYEPIAGFGLAGRGRSGR
jgi:RNA 2',3'-cyclic 3'-phosphodiesterase